MTGEPIVWIGFGAFVLAMLALARHPGNGVLSSAKSGERLHHALLKLSRPGKIR